MSKGTHNMAFITFQCYACGKALKVPVDKAGRKAKCNQCGTILTIPAQSSMPESSTGAAPAAPSAAPQAPTYPTAIDSSTQVQPPVVPQEQAYEPAFADFVQPEAPAPVRYAPPPAPGGYPQQQGNFAPPVPPGNFAPPQPAGYPAPPAPGGFPPQYAGAPQPMGAGQEYVGDEALDVSLKSKWGFVRLGMLLCFIGSCVMAGAYVLQAIGWLVVTIPTVQFLTTFNQPSPTSYQPVQVLLGLAAIVALGATLTSIVGYVFCIIGPNKNGSMGLSIAATAVAAVGLLLILIVELPFVFGPSTTATRAPQGFFVTWFFLLLIQLLFVAEMILVPLLIRALALSVKKRSLANSAKMPMFLIGGYGGARLLTFIFWLIWMGVTTEMPIKVMGWITLIFLWVGIFVFILYLVVNTLFLWRARDVVPMHRVERLS